MDYRDRLPGWSISTGVTGGPIDSHVDQGRRFNVHEPRAPALDLHSIWAQNIMKMADSNPGTISPLTDATNVVSLPPPPRRPGRPPKPRPEPGPTARESELRRLATLDRLVDEDPLVRACQGDDPQVMDVTIRQLAYEQAELSWQVRRARARRLETAGPLAARRVRALASIAGVVIAKAKLGTSSSDPIPPGVLTKLQAMFVGEVRAAAEETVGAELAAALVERLKDRILVPPPESRQE